MGAMMPAAGSSMERRVGLGRRGGQIRRKLKGMKKGIYTILRNEALTGTVYRMVLRGDTSAIVAPGQFVDVALEGLYLRRPISVCDWDGEDIVLVYKVVGAGTGRMALMSPGETLDLLTGLGNGFDPYKYARPLLVGGGVGVPPLYGLAKAMVASGLRPTVVMGFNTAREVFLEGDFKAMGLSVTVATADGSRGVKGFVTDALAMLLAGRGDAASDMPFDGFCACGPIPMLRALCDACDLPGQLSLEERMGCGFGACMGCTHEMLGGGRRICKDGPVFDREEVLW